MRCDKRLKLPRKKINKMCVKLDLFLEKFNGIQEENLATKTRGLKLQAKVFFFSISADEMHPAVLEPADEKNFPKEQEKSCKNNNASKKALEHFFIIHNINRILYLYTL